MKIILLVAASTAAIAFASAAWADSNTVYLYQSGSDQNATVDQGGGGGNAISAYQYGGNVALDFLQDGASNKIGTTSSGVQNGDDLWATIQQHGANGDVEYSQYGTTNGLQVVQSSNWDIATINQNGTFLTAYDNQYGGDGNIASFSQTGTMNIIGQTGAQFGSGGQITASQTGSNEALNFSQGGINNIINSSQWGVGASGTALIEQNLNTVGGSNYVSNSQGANTYLYASQDGSSNNLYNVQNNGAYAELSQNGVGNYLTGNQSGDNSAQNQAHVYQGVSWQAANYNTATYSQSGGGGNVVNITQTSSSNSANVTQNGAGNSASITQH
jgi:hypothetical protein